MSYSDYSKGQEHAYYGFGRYYDNYDYRRGYNEEMERQEREAYENEMRKEYEKAYENEYMREMEEAYYMDEYYSTKQKDCKI